MRYDAILRARVSAELKQRLEELAAAERRDLPDYLRMVLEDYCDQQSEIMRLPKGKDGRYPPLPPRCTEMNEHPRRKPSKP